MRSMPSHKDDIKNAEKRRKISCGEPLAASGPLRPHRFAQLIPVVPLERIFLGIGRASIDNQYCSGTFFVLSCRCAVRGCGRAEPPLS